MVPRTESKEPPETEESRKSSWMSLQMSAKAKAKANSRLNIPGISLSVLSLSSLFHFPSLFPRSDILLLQEP